MVVFTPHYSGKCPDRRVSFCLFNGFVDVQIFSPLDLDMDTRKPYHIRITVGSGILLTSSTTIEEGKKEIRKESNNTMSGASSTSRDSQYAIIVDYLNLRAGTQYKHSSEDTRKLIRDRMAEGYTVDDFKAVIDKKTGEWKGTDKERYLRPVTLFGTKMESYVNQKITIGSCTKQTGFSNFQQREYDFDALERELLESQKG